MSSLTTAPASGESLRRRPTVRLTVLQAARVVERGQVMAARAPDQGNRHMAVVRTDSGRIFAVPDECPHDRGLLSDGYVEGDRLVCARHGWEFDAESGECQTRRGVCIASCPVSRQRRPKGPFLTE